jgi:hypothetical protein
MLVLRRRLRQERGARCSASIAVASHHEGGDVRTAFVIYCWIELAVIVLLALMVFSSRRRRNKRDAFEARRREREAERLRVIADREAAARAGNYELVGGPYDGTVVPWLPSGPMRLGSSGGLYALGSDQRMHYNQSRRTS